MTRAARTFSMLLLGVVSLAAPLACATPGEQLEGTGWKLTGWALSAQKPGDFVINARFDAGEISGKSAVNRYSGPCKLGPGNAIEIGPLASTRMAGPEPSMRAESAYLKLLGQAKSYALADDRLTLFDAAGNASLIFEAARP